MLAFRSKKSNISSSLLTQFLSLCFQDSQNLSNQHKLDLLEDIVGLLLNLLVPDPQFLLLCQSPCRFLLLSQLLPSQRLSPLLLLLWLCIFFLHLHFLFFRFFVPRIDHKSLCLFEEAFLLKQKIFFEKLCCQKQVN